MYTYMYTCINCNFIFSLINFHLIIQFAIVFQCQFSESWFISRIYLSFLLLSFFLVFKDALRSCVALSHSKVWVVSLIITRNHTKIEQQRETNFQRVRVFAENLRKWKWPLNICILQPSYLDKLRMRSIIIADICNIGNNDQFRERDENKITGLQNVNY